MRRGCRARGRVGGRRGGVSGSPCLYPPFPASCPCWLAVAPSLDRCHFCAPLGPGARLGALTSRNGELGFVVSRRTRGDFVLHRARTPLVGRVSAVPAGRGQLVGRERELEELGRWICSGERLITITGPAGMGKTRIATELARARALSDATFVDLVPERDSDGVRSAVATALRLSLFAGTSSSEEQVAQRLASLGRVCIVLDNFEHLLAHAAAALSLWVEKSPEACFVVTSRERLRLERERAFELGPLAVPAEGGDDAPCDATRLFTARMQAVRSGYAPNRSELTIIGRIVRRLEGLPLAIELSAARASTLGTARLLAELEAGITRLSTDRRDAAHRHLTLNAAVAWSWNLLGAHERSTLACLSVLRGGFSAEAAAAVVADEAHDCTETLSALRERSFLFTTEAVSPGEVRWSMYEYIRSFASGALDSDDRTEVESRHSRFFLDFAESCAREIDRDPLALRRLSFETENILAAQERALRCRGAEAANDALRVALALDHIFEDRGPPERRVSTLERALRHPDLALVDPDRVAGVWRLRALCLVDQRDLVAAQAALDRADEAIRTGAYPATAARIAVDRGCLAFEAGHLSEARAVLDAALQACQAAGEITAAAYACFLLGRVAEHSASMTGAESEAFRALDLLRGIGAVRPRGLLLLYVSEAQHQLRRTTWLGYANEARAIAESFGNDRLLAKVETSVGSGLLDLGDIDAAERHISKGIALAQRVGDRYFEAVSRAQLGQVALERGDFFRARALEEAAMEGASARIFHAMGGLGRSSPCTRRGQVGRLCPRRAPARGRARGQPWGRGHRRRHGHTDLSRVRRASHSVCIGRGARRTTDDRMEPDAAALAEWRARGIRRTPARTYASRSGISSARWRNAGMRALSKMPCHGFSGSTGRASRPREARGSSWNSGRRHAGSSAFYCGNGRGAPAQSCRASVSSTRVGLTSGCARRPASTV